MSKKSICLKQWEIPGILDGSKTLIVRPITPQPHDVPEGAYMDPYNKNYRRFTMWTADHRMCLGCGGNVKGMAHWDFGFIPGDVLLGRETWNYGDAAGDIDTKYIYRADEAIREILYDIPWKSSAIMPPEAVRIKLSVSEVRVMRVQDITIKEIEKLGYPHGIDWNFLPIAQQGIMFEWFEKMFKSDNPKLKLVGNPWIIAVDIEGMV